MESTTNNRKHLGALKKGTVGIISHFSNPLIGGKLMAMGFLPGTQVQLIRKAPFGGGCYVKAKNISVALRQAEANSIILK